MNAQRDNEAYFHQSIRAYKKHEIERAFYRVELHIVWVTADMRVIKLEKGDKSLELKLLSVYKLREKATLSFSNCSKLRRFVNNSFKEQNKFDDENKRYRNKCNYSR